MPISTAFPSTGLRFFTVYGPWGRPTWRPFLFTRRHRQAKPIKVFNHGEMWRDFTYIDDIVDGVLRALDRPATGTPPHKLYNLGNHKSEKLTDFIAEIEQALQKKAIIELRADASPAMCSRPMPISRPRPAIWALSPPRRSASAFPNSSPGIASFTAFDCGPAPPAA